MPMLPDGTKLPYGPQTSAAPFAAPGRAPGTAGDLSALLGDPGLMAAMAQQQATAPQPTAAPLMDPKAPGGPIVDPARPTARPPLTGGAFPVRGMLGMAPGAPAAPFPTSNAFRAAEMARRPMMRGGGGV